MKVWVVMGNDYPEAVFDSEEKAEAFIVTIKLKNSLDDPHRIYWRAYSFLINQTKGTI